MANYYTNIDELSEIFRIQFPGEPATEHAVSKLGYPSVFVRVSWCDFVDHPFFSSQKCDPRNHANLHEGRMRGKLEFEEVSAVGG